MIIILGFVFVPRANSENLIIIFKSKSSTIIKIKNKHVAICTNPCEYNLGRLDPCLRQCNPLLW